MGEQARKSPARLALVVVIIAAVAGGCVWTWMEYFSTYHFAVVTDGVLYRDGVRSKREFQTGWRKAQFRTVVSLVTADEQKQAEFIDEEAFCRANGIELIHIPVTLGGEPKAEDVEKFVSIVQDKSRWPVLVHCAQGILRTGMMVAGYQQKVLGYNKQQAMNAILDFGKGQERREAVGAFIEKWYDTQVIPAKTQATAAATTAGGS